MPGNWGKRRGTYFQKDIVAGLDGVGKVANSRWEVEVRMSWHGITGWG